MKAIGFPLWLSVSGLIRALLVFSAGRLLDGDEHGGRPGPPGIGSAPGCTSFFVGLQRPGTTHVHLANGGRETIITRLELLDELGTRRAAESYRLGPYATWDVALGRPPTETGIKVSSASPDLRVNAEVVFDDGSEPEPYRAGRCA